jgi:TonB family protein
VARIAAVLLLDAVLCGSGIAMGLSWWSSRHAVAAPQPSPESKPVAETSEATPAAPETEPPPPQVVAEEPRKVDRPASSGDAPSPGTRPGGGRTPPPVVVPPVWPGAPDAAPAAVPVPPPPESQPEPTPAPATPDAAAMVVDDEDAEISTEAVRNVVHQHMGDVKRCYTRNAKVGTSTQPIEGKVEIQFTIRTTGDAEDVRVVENTTGSEPLGTCVAALLSSWSFPSPGEDVEFVWPFVFKAPK